MAESFVALKSEMDGVMEEKNMALKKAGETLAVNLSSGKYKNKTEMIDKLLDGFSDSEKYIIMKYAFLKCI